MRYIFLFAFALALAWIPRAFADQLVPYGIVGPWSVAAQLTDQGVFEACAIFQDGGGVHPSVSISISQTGYLFRMSKDDWVLPDGDAYGVTVSIDGQTWNGNALTDRSITNAPNGVSMRFPWSANFGPALEHGSRMTIVFSNGRSWFLPLAGSAAAMTRMGRCLSDNMGHNPFAGSPPVPSTTPTNNPFR